MEKGILTRDPSGTGRTRSIAPWKQITMPKRKHNVAANPDVTPMVRKVLGNEAYYGDGPPQWLEGKHQRRCQTASEADAERKRAIKRLRRFGKDNPKALRVADRLASCQPDSRCMSGACPECARAWQRWSVAATAAFLESQPRKFRTILSPVHADGIAEPGTLCSTGPLGHLDILEPTVLSALARVGIRTAILGVDISFNEDRDGEVEPHWLIHLRGLVPKRLSKRTDKALRGKFPVRPDPETDALNTLRRRLGGDRLIGEAWV